MADTYEFLDYAGLTEFKNSLNGVDIVTTAGTGAAYTATVPGITALKAGLTITLVPHTVSTVVNPTLNVNSLGAKNIRRRVSNSTATTVASAAANWLAASKPIRVTYDGTYWIADLDRPNATDIYGTLAIANGGTGATTAAAALTNLGLTATAAELNYMDGVTSAVQTQLNGKAASSHNHSGGTIKPLCIEMTPGSSAGHGGFIDFHFNGDSADYTSRIIEYEKGYVSLNGNRIITAENIICIYGASITFSGGKATYTHSFIKPTSIVFVQRMADAANCHQGFNTCSGNGAVTVYTDASISYAVNVNVLIFNP